MLHNSLNPLFYPFIAEHDITWRGTSCWLVRLLCLVMSPPNLWLTPRPFTRGAGVIDKYSVNRCKNRCKRTREGLDAVQTLVSKSEQLQRTTSIVLATALKHSTLQAAIKNINSIPARRSTGEQATAGGLWGCSHQLQLIHPTGTL